MMTIVATGRGGVGKTCFTAGLARLFCGRGPLLLIDADPDQSLAEMVGVDLPGEGAKTVSDVFFDIREGNLEEGFEALGLSQQVDLLLKRDVLYEGEGFDLISLGVKWTAGCYCRPNYLLKTLLSQIRKQYAYVLVDAPAGIEHLNRRVTNSVDTVFAIIGPSSKSFENAKRSKKIMEEVGIAWRNFFTVAGYEYPESLLERVRQNTELPLAGKLESDPEVARLTLEGQSLLHLTDASPFLKSLRAVLKVAGLERRE
jgi:CO dehydrogenase maturation factor